MPPISAALVVTVMPLAALISAPFERRVASPRTRAAAGTLLGTGGVAALGLLPGAGWAWTLAPQLLVGAGLALSLGALTEAAWRAVACGHPRRRHDRRTPRRRRARARAAHARVRRRPRPPARAGHPEGRRARAGRAHRRAHEDRSGLAHRERHPAAARAAARHPPLVRLGGRRASASDRSCGCSSGRLNEQLDRAATSSFERSFLFAAVLAALALIPIALTRRVEL